MPPQPGDRRPDPERLLRQVTAQERQAARERLKIFLGYASGVGKSFRMFDEARRRHERGQDVVVGAVQPQCPHEVDELLRRLETIPYRSSGGRDVLDVEAILRRKPGVCIVDGLAYNNPPGSRHPARWQDVEELVTNGITVITSLNLQHIEEEREQVEKITGKHVTETVPKQFLGLADEIVVVDVPSEMLLARTGQEPAGPERARELAELREMTLLLTAEVVDRQLEDYLEAQGADQTWGAHERILVCLTPRANAPRMLASGKRNADRFRGDLLVAYVEQHGLAAPETDRIERSLDAARALGAAVHVLEGDDPIETILRFALSHRITQIFVGHTLRDTWWRRLTGGPLDQLIRGAEGIDVRIFPH
jgi:two-component system sensor histidine kinase KdpD